MGKAASSYTLPDYAKVSSRGREPGPTIYGMSYCFRHGKNRTIDEEAHIISYSSFAPLNPEMGA
jgi:hypothetical protein